MFNITYYYLSLKQKITNTYHNFLIYSFSFTTIKTISNNQQHNLIFRYLIYTILSNIINFLTKIKNKVDIKATKIELTKISPIGKKTIILENDQIIFDDIANQLFTLTPDDNMYPHTFLLFELLNPNSPPICLKNLIVKYKDLEQNYNHSLENIFIFNNIEYSNESIINIRSFVNKKIVSCKIPYNNIKTKHINNFMVLENEIFNHNQK
jgi:hypothetical protein